MERQAINYEVAVANIAVRDAMKRGERHPFLKDDRADQVLVGEGPFEEIEPVLAPKHFVLVDVSRGAEYLTL